MTVLTARQRVLEFLGRRKSATAAQIGHALNMSAATVRHHLAILAADGRVAAAGVESKGKRGRPDKMYRLSEKILGEGFEMLSEALITTWLQGLPVSKQEAALGALAGAVTAQIGKPDDIPACYQAAGSTHREAQRSALSSALGGRCGRPARTLWALSLRSHCCETP